MKCVELLQADKTVELSVRFVFNGHCCFWTKYKFCQILCSHIIEHLNKKIKWSEKAWSGQDPIYMESDTSNRELVVLLGLVQQSTICTFRLLHTLISWHKSGYKNHNIKPVRWRFQLLPYESNRCGAAVKPSQIHEHCKRCENYSSIAIYFGDVAKKVSDRNKT